MPPSSTRFFRGWGSGRNRARSEWPSLPGAPSGHVHVTTGSGSPPVQVPGAGRGGAATPGRAFGWLACARPASAAARVASRQRATRRFRAPAYPRPDHSPARRLVVRILFVFCFEWSCRRWGRGTRPFAREWGRRGRGTGEHADAAGRVVRSSGSPRHDRRGVRRGGRRAPGAGQTPSAGGRRRGCDRRAFRSGGGAYFGCSPSIAAGAAGVAGAGAGTGGAGGVTRRASGFTVSSLRSDSSTFVASWHARSAPFS